MLVYHRSVAAQTRQATDSTYTESRVYGVSEDTVLGALPTVLEKTLGVPLENPLPGCFTARIDGMPSRELIIRVEEEPEGTRVRLDVRPWQDSRMVALGVLAAVLVLPIFLYLIWLGIRALVAPAKTSHPPEVIAHGIFRGLSKALSSTGGSGPGYRIAAKSDAHLSREEAEEEDEAVSDPKLRRG